MELMCNRFRRQMTCNAADDKSTMKNESTPRNGKLSFDKNDLSTNIVKQVETWMKNQSFSEQYAPLSQRSHYTPPNVSEQGRKRRKKRNSQKDGESLLESSESVNYTTESEIISTTESSQPQRKPIDRKFETGNVFKGPRATKLTNGFTSEYFNRSFERPNQNTRFGSIHDEIEFQKRYKRISDLQNHIQFVNGSYLSGKNVFSEQKKLDPVKGVRRYKNLETSDMFSISPLEKHDIKKSLRQKYNSLEATPVLDNFKKKPLSWQKFQKLPNINPNRKIPKKAMSESNVKLGEESEREAGKPGYAISAQQSQEDVKDERARSVITNSSYGPYQEMKVTIHIRYKNPNTTPEVNSDDDYCSENSSVGSLVDNTPYSYDGRIHGLHTASKTNQPSQKTSPISEGGSRSSNISRKSKEHYKSYEGGGLPAILINDPVSKTPRFITGKISY